MLPWVEGLAAVLVLAALGGYLWFRFGGSYEDSGGSGISDLLPLKQKEVETGGHAAESAELERSKLVIHALLQSVSDGLASLLDDTSNYSDSLERHKNDVKKSTTLASIRELERVILHELEQMQATTQIYRRELDEAKEQIQEQREQLEQLQSDASLDFLTKIPNRRTFDERLREEINRARRYGSTFSLMLVDVDHFKTVNDLHGHQAGDRVLRAIAQILDEQRRASDFLARYGGEEFVVLLPETTAERAFNLAEKTRDKMQNARFRYSDQTIRLTVSIGIGDFRPQEDTLDSLFGRVDQALYEAKRKGRNQVQIATDS